MSEAKKAGDALRRVRARNVWWALAAGVAAGAGTRFAAASGIVMAVLGLLVAVGVYLWLVDDNKSWGDLGQGLLVGIVVSLVLLFVQRDADQRLRRVTDRQAKQTHHADVMREQANARQALELELWRGTRLTGLSLPYADLTGFRFAHRSLVGAQLTGSRLERVDFGHADLRRLSASVARFDAAWLVGADLRRARLVGASFDGANLKDSDLRGVRAYGAHFTGAWLVDADLRDATLTRRLDKPAAFTVVAAPDPNAGGRESDSQAASFVRAQLARAVMTGVGLRAVDFTDARMRHVRLACADLTLANLRGADLTGADLSGAALDGAVLSNAQLAGVNLSGALYDAATKWPRGFDFERAGAQFDEDGFGLQPSCP